MLEPDSGSWRYLEPTIHSGTLQEKNCPLCNSKLNLILPRLRGLKYMTIYNLLSGFETKTILESSSLWPVNLTGLTSSPIRKTRAHEAWLCLSQKEHFFTGPENEVVEELFLRLSGLSSFERKCFLPDTKNGHPRAAKREKRTSFECPGHIFCSHFS